ncbi:hypothetical protein N7456_003270 [Penicillium angulare]|uniref:Uncharacterized protein n=1 Tax=Penicillium angulare TaxID=116970 RepID=A0A9W9FUZ0_9EURO|nr:hypothetical protein N7456_003270 [Penicillium angulare]
MAICMILLENHVRGDFYSCFPLKEHFDHLGRADTPLDTIKFGNAGPEALHTYSKAQFDNGNVWWTEVGRTEIRQRIEYWISQKSAAAQPGDVVDIFMEGHGNRTKGFNAGSEFIHPDVFTQLVSHFRPGVQLNIILDFGYAGGFAKSIEMSKRADCYVVAACSEVVPAFSHARSISGRLRSGKFTTAFVHSLRKISSNPKWSMKDQEAFVYHQLTRNLTPGENISTPEFWLSDNLSPMLPLREIFFRGMISVSSHGHRSAGRHQRVEWPTANVVIRRRLGNDTQEPIESPLLAGVTKLMNNEMSRCDTTVGYPPDMGVFNEMYTNAPDWRGLVRNLYWRARRQSTVWDVYLLLVERGLVASSSLEHPMNLLAISKSTGILTLLLGCFSNISGDADMALLGEIALQPSDWSADIEWLATIVVRSGCKHSEIFQTIIDSEYLGKIDRSNFERIKSRHPEFILEQKPLDREGSFTGDGRLQPNKNTFGFWLPHGVNLQEAKSSTKGGQYGFFDRFEEAERMFFEAEGITKGDDLIDVGQEFEEPTNSMLEPEDSIIPGWFAGE